MNYIIGFIAGTVFGIMLSALLGCNRNDDVMSAYYDYLYNNQMKD